MQEAIRKDRHNSRIESWLGSMYNVRRITRSTMYQKAPPIPDDTTKFLHRRADTKHNVTCEDGLD